MPAEAGAVKGHVVLAGDDRLAVRVLEELRELDVAVKAVCTESEAPLAHAAHAAGVLLIVGEVEKTETLRAAAVEGARACAFLGSGDLANLHAALEVQELAPEARVVLRVFDAALAQTMRDLLGDAVVLSAEELAAPAFVEAALRGSADFTLRVGDRQVTVQEVDGDDPRLWLALAEADVDGEPALFPRSADRVLGIVDQGQLTEAREPGMGGDLDVRIRRRAGGHASTARRVSHASWLVLRGIVGVVDRRLAVVGALFGLLVVGSTLVFGRYLGISLVDGLYFVVTTVTTTGYGDINLLKASEAVKLFGVVVMILGALVLALVFALITDAIVGARLAQALGHGPLPKRDHVIVCGIGRTGKRVIEGLIEASVACVAVDRDEDVDSALLRQLGVPLVVGDVASAETLAGLRLGSAQALMAMTSDDLANLQCALLARAQASDLRVVLRLFDPDLAVRVQRATDIQLSRSVSALAAPAFVAAILGRRATALLPVGAEVMQIVGMTAERPTDVRTLEETCEARVLAVDGTAFPELDTPLRPGHEVIVVGTGRGLAQVEGRIMPSALTST